MNLLYRPRPCDVVSERQEGHLQYVHDDTHGPAVYRPAVSLPADHLGRWWVGGGHKTTQPQLLKSDAAQPPSDPWETGGSSRWRGESPHCRKVKGGKVARPECVSLSPPHALEQGCRTCDPRTDTVRPTTNSVEHWGTGNIMMLQGK